MGRKPREVLEYRQYDLSAHFPIFLLCGEKWRISDVPSGVLHFHNVIEIGLCESDSGYLGLQGESHRFSAGDVSFISGDVAHTTWSDPGTASKWSYLFVDPEELLRPLFAIDDLPNAALFQQLLYGTFSLIHPKEGTCLRSLVEAMIRELSERRMNYEISVRGIFLTFITEMMRHVSHGNRTEPPRRMSLAPALQYMNTQYMEDFTIEHLATQCGMSESHFRALFHQTMGMGPLEYLNHMRIRRACSLLRMTDSSILTISERVGFRTLSSFNRHFAAEMGLSPTAWRRVEGASRKTEILRYSGWLVPPPPRVESPAGPTAP